MSILSRHPFPVVAHFSKSLVVAFAIRAEEVVDLIPDGLDLDLFEDKWAFLAVAMVDTRSLRPKGFPKFLGRDFLLAGYRVFVRYRGADGRRRRGLYILGSETNRFSMKLLGGIFTQYRYQHTEIDWESGDSGREVVSSAGGLRVEVRGAGEGEVALPQGSPFTTAKQARQFAGPMPFTFTYDERAERMVIVEGQRSTWKPQPVQLLDWQVPFWKGLRIDAASLAPANAFLVEDVPYQWKRGRTERCLPEGPS